ncbi:glycosyltransferase family 25 protein [Pseudoxanthomonas suwonensis]|uniref:Glycosyl transferase family 25 domain-containing protein n=1 Tax=Pseudoxanthomonas suwonensis TaxID=314722 RepID=A0A0E3YZA1_9GAMM|nr:glycosyltransferase family 25 protein [Pseudoxanthomonas suwonensis]AKC85898.1 hypothetical protein WQ53_03105 [Pseudoxanthomonas suwonensis]
MSPPLPRAIHVINLDRARERMASVVRSYDAHLGDSGIALNRFVAVDAAEAARLGTPGTLNWAEKACCISHGRCLQAAADPAYPAWIAEDDVAFGPWTLRRIREALAEVGDRPWDVLLTDIYATDVHGMVDLFRLRRRLLAERRTKLIDLRGMAFASATSYLVNASSIPKVIGLLQERTQLDMVPDIWMKTLAGAGKLICLGVFPFATTVADTPTQIQPESSSRELGWWTAYRWLLWDGTDPAWLEGKLAALETGSRDPESALLGRILAGTMSEADSRGG